MCPMAQSCLSTATAAGWLATAWATTTTQSQGHLVGAPRGPAWAEEVTTLIRTVPCPASTLCAASAVVVTSRPECPSTTTTSQHGAPALLCLHIPGTILVIFQKSSTSDSSRTDTAAAYQGTRGCRAAPLMAGWMDGPRARPASRGRAWGASWAPCSLRAWWSKSWMLTHTSQTCLNWFLSSRATGRAKSPSRLERFFCLFVFCSNWAHIGVLIPEAKWKTTVNLHYYDSYCGKTLAKHIPNLAFILALKNDSIWGSLEHVADWMLFLYYSIKVQCTTLRTCYFL